ncbi:MAG: MBL fold metallo-hydrolase [Anaerolineales bacterium]
MSEDEKINYEEIEIVGDGRGTMQGDYLLNQDRPMDRIRWLLECFPEWGRFLNRQIEETEVKEGTYAMWWMGGMGFVIKSPGGAVLLVDNYAGPAHYTEYEYCGVCRTSGSPTIDWLRLNPQVIDIWGFETLDGVFCSHQHADHTDIYTLKAATQTSDCPFYAPLSSVERMRTFQVPEERINLVRPGEKYQIKDVEIEILPNYDRIATMTGGPGVEIKPGERRPYEDVAVTFFFKIGGVNLAHLADTLFQNAYTTFKQYGMDVITFNIGTNAPGATDKMTPYDAVRMAEAIDAKVLMPMHWDNWGNTYADPSEVVWVTERHYPKAKVVIPAWGVKWVYPDDAEIGRMKWEDWRERYRPEYSWEYGKPAAEAAKERAQFIPY